MEKCDPILFFFFYNPQIFILENLLLVQYVPHFEKKTAL